MTSLAPKALGAVSVTKASEHLLAFSTFFPSGALGSDALFITLENKAWREA